MAEADRDQPAKGAIGKNLSALVLAQFATAAISIVVLILAPRKLGDAQFGELTVALTYLMFFDLVALLGTNVFLVKTIARDPSRVGSYVFNTLVMKLCLSTVLAVLAISLSYVLGYSTQVRAIIAVGCIGMIVVTLNDALTAGLQGLERMARPAAWGVVQQYVTTGFGILVLLTGRGLILYAITLSCFGFISLVPNIRYLWPELSGHLRIDLSLWKTVTLGGLPFATWAAVSLIYGSIDILMLEAMTNDATVGWYGVAWAWVGFPAFFSSIVVTVFLPSLSHRGTSDSPEFALLANKALRLVMFVGAPAAAGIALVARPMLDLFYPPDYQHAVPLLRILALHIPFVAMDMILGIALVARDRQKQWLVVGCVAAVFNPLINLGLIPLTTNVFSNGAIGAAVATVATEGFMMAWAIRLRPQGVLDRSTGRYLARCLLAAALILPVGLLIGDRHLVAQVAMGVLTYGVASLALRTTSVGEVRYGIRRVRAVVASRGHDVSASSLSSEQVAA
jgi:O-antigen/teichoic acid export membrane protein